MSVWSFSNIHVLRKSLYYLLHSHRNESIASEREPYHIFIYYKILSSDSVLLRRWRFWFFSFAYLEFNGLTCSSLNKQTNWSREILMSRCLIWQKVFSKSIMSNETLRRVSKSAPIIEDPTLFQDPFQKVLEKCIRRSHLNLPGFSQNWVFN